MSGVGSESLPDTWHPAADTQHPSMRRATIGLIGAGVIGHTHSVVLQQLRTVLRDRVQLVAVADPDAAGRDRCAEAYGYTARFADGLELIREADINTVFICPPTRYHADLVDAAAARGLHIFCEKPLAMDVAEAAGMVAAVETAGVTAQIGLVLRFSAVYTVMRALALDPCAGAPRAVVFRDDQCFPIRGIHRSAWRADRTVTAGGTLIEHGVHDLDLLTWVFGPVARLRAWEENRAGHPGIEDYVAIELEFATGLRAQLVNLWHDMVQRPSNRRLEIFCDRAFVASDADMSGPVRCQYGDGAEQDLSEAAVQARFLELYQHLPEPLWPWAGVPYLVQDHAFVAALLAGRRAAPDLRAGLAAQQLAAAVYHAAHTGEQVDVEAFVGPRACA